MARFVLQLVALAAIFLRVNAAQAQYTYEWSADGGTTFLANGANVSVGAVGSTVKLRLFLRETGGGTTLANPGLYSAAARVNFTNPTTGSAPLVATGQNADILGNTDGPNSFNSPGDLVRIIGSEGGTGFAKLSEIIANGSPNGVVSVNQRVFLGDFRFNVLGTATTDVSVIHLDPPDNTLLNDGTFTTAIGGNISSVSLTLTPVPEPATVLAVAAGGLAVVSWRRKRAKMS